MKKNKLGELYNLALDSMDVAVSIIDTKGTPLYYNRQSARILDRKPEYIGTNIHSHHQRAANEKLDQMLKNFENGRTKPFLYEARPYGKVIFVTLAPLIKDGALVGCVQTIRTKEGDVP